MNRLTHSIAIAIAIQQPTINNLLLLYRPSYNCKLEINDNNKKMYGKKITPKAKKK